MLDADLQRRAAHERRVLLRSPDPLVAAAIKLAKLRAALIASQPPRDATDFVRASGDCECPVCGDPYIDHPAVPAEPYPFLHVLCTGEQVKL